MGAVSGKPSHARLDKIVGSSSSSLILMENRRFFGFFLLLLLIFLMASEERVVVARTCESQSFGFKGGCWSTHNCALVCLNENFTGGKCKGFRHRCFCTKPCDA